MNNNPFNMKKLRKSSWENHKNKERKSKEKISKKKVMYHQIHLMIILLMYHQMDLLVL